MHKWNGYVKQSETASLGENQYKHMYKYLVMVVDGHVAIIVTLYAQHDNVGSSNISLRRPTDKWW